MTSRRPQYFLADHAYVCVTQGYLVFLDLKNDKYSALTPADACAIAPAVAGWPVAASAHAPLQVGTGPDSEKILRELYEDGLITLSEAAGKDARAVVLEKPCSDLRTALPGSPVVPIPQAMRFVRAWAMITLALRTRPLEYSVERVRRRKARSAGTARRLSADDLHRLASMYFALQPHFFSAYNTCLRNSLTLVEYLAYHGVYPTWVFGVRMDPWAAHCWVQEGSLVLNDAVEHVRRFTPILLI